MTGWGRTLGTRVQPRHDEAWYIRQLRYWWPKRNGRADGKPVDTASARRHIFVNTVQIRRLRDVAAQRER